MDKMAFHVQLPLQGHDAGNLSILSLLLFCRNNTTEDILMWFTVWQYRGRDKVQRIKVVLKHKIKPIIQS